MVRRRYAGVLNANANIVKQVVFERDISMFAKETNIENAKGNGNGKLQLQMGTQNFTTSLTANANAQNITVFNIEKFTMVYYIYICNTNAIQWPKVP